MQLPIDPWKHGRRGLDSLQSPIGICDIQWFKKGVYYPKMSYFFLVCPIEMLIPEVFCESPMSFKNYYPKNLNDILLANVRWIVMIFLVSDSFCLANLRQWHISQLSPCCIVMNINLNSQVRSCSDFGLFFFMTFLHYLEEFISVTPVTPAKIPTTRELFFFCF